MRTTVTLAPDVASAVEQLRQSQGGGISEVINDLVRKGLASEQPRQRFEQRASDLGVPRLNLDDISGLLDVLEGDDRRT